MVEKDVALAVNPPKFTEWLHHVRTTDLCKLLLETCQIYYRKSVRCESNIFLHDFFSFAAATSLVSDASKLSEKSFSTNSTGAMAAATSQNFTIFET